MSADAESVHSCMDNPGYLARMIFFAEMLLFPVADLEPNTGSGLEPATFSHTLFVRDIVLLNGGFE